MFLKKIDELFSGQGIPFAIVGGYAVAIHGVARGTFDLDIITELNEGNLIKLETALLSLNFKSTFPISASEIARNLKRNREEKNLMAWNFVNLSKQRESLDILLTEDIRECSFFHAETDFGSVPVISLEDLIRIKSKTQRTQDIEDVVALKKIQKQRSNT